MPSTSCAPGSPPVVMILPSHQKPGSRADLSYTEDDERLLADAFEIISGADWYQQMPEV